MARRSILVIHVTRARPGTAIIFISHRLEELFELADRVTVLRDGNYVDICFLKDVSRDDLICLIISVCPCLDSMQVAAGCVDGGLREAFQRVNLYLHLERVESL